MKKIIGLLALAVVLFTCGCKEDCETNDTGSIKITNPNNGFNPDSIDVFIGISKLGTVRLLGERTFDKLPAGKREFIFKYQGDTLYIDSISITACLTMSYTIDWVPVSDKRLKTAIKPLSPVLSNLLQLSTYTFEYDREQFPNYALPSGAHVGFLAQDLQQHFPNAVVPYRDGFYAVNYYEMIPVLTKAIQEQQKEIDDLKGDVAELKQLLQQQTAMK